jgi:hypothetical protein
LARKYIVGYGMALAVLMLLYLPTLAPIPNGSDHQFMADVGEAQTLLNLWGHCTPPATRCT